MIDYYLLQRKDNIAYKSNIHSIYIFCLSQQKHNMVYMHIIE